jgi:NodT family efflux transporter outer membrane factor (OMF) lipoprotein
MMRFDRLALTTVATLLAGCTVGPDYTAAKPDYTSPSYFAARPPVLKAALPSQPVAEPVEVTWWQIFGDAQLSALMQRVAAANLDVRIAGIRLAESRAQLGIARADEMPTLNANGSYTRERLSQKGVIGLLGGGGSSGGSFTGQSTSANGLGGTSGAVPSTVTGGTVIPPFNVFQYGFDASWEIDFWGHAKREVEAAGATVTANEDSRRNALLTVLAEVARDYVQLRGVQANMRITNENLDTARQSLRLTQERAAGGLTTDLDVANAQAQVATTASQLPALQQQQAQYINALSLLVAEPPNALTRELTQVQAIPPVPPKVPVGLPSELARRRPDVRQAEAQLHAATADIGVAVADFYPRVTLSGSIGLQALAAKNLGDWASRQYGFGPSVTLPLFEGGRLKATLELRKQQQQEAAVTYQKTVLQALHDVDNALTAYTSEQLRHAQLEAAVTANRRALGLARDRYNEGLATFLDVLDAQRSLLATQTQLVDSTTTESTNLVALYKALGGGWESTYPDATNVAVKE